MTCKGKSGSLSGNAWGEKTGSRGESLPATALALCLLAPAVFAGDLVLGNFSAGDLAGWRPKRFRGETSYSLVVEGGRRVLKAQSRGAASGLYKEVDLDPAT